MTDKQPEALEMATELEEDGRWRHANLIRTQHAAIERKDALLRQSLDVLRSTYAGFEMHPSIFSAIHKELQCPPTSS